MTLTSETTGTVVVEPHYKVAKVAELLDVSVQWVYDRIKSGEIARVVELGTGKGNQRVPASELNRFLEERTFGLTNSKPEKNA